jgi:hypothetical protein
VGSSRNGFEPGFLGTTVKKHRALLRMEIHEMSNHADGAFPSIQFRFP